MANNFFKVDKGVTLAPQASVASPQDGDVYYDSARATYVFRNNGSNVDLQKRTDVASASSLTSSTLTASVVQSSLIKLTGSTQGDIHGFASASDAKSFVFYNATTQPQTLKHQSGTESTAGNRIVTSDGTDLVLTAGQAVQVGYDSTQARWVVLTSPGSGSGSGSGGINYITNSSAESSTTGYAVYADAAAALPVDGTGGSPNVTFTRTTSSPLRGLGSFLFTKDAANRQGQGASYDFTISSADKGKVLAISFDYAIASGTYANSDLTVYVYDVTNGVVIQPAGYSILNAVTDFPVKQIATFQTASNSTSYRLIWHVASTSASAYTVKMDNIIVGPQMVQYGAPVTDWKQVTSPTGSWTTNTSYKVYWRRVGDSVEINAVAQLTGANAVDGDLTFSASQILAGTGIVFDSAKLAAIGMTGSTDLQAVGVGMYEDQGAAQRGGVSVMYRKSNGNLEPIPSGASNFTATSGTPITWADGDSISFMCTLPVVGWSSNLQMSNDTDTRVCTARYGAVSGQNTSGTPAIVDFATKYYDTHTSVTTGGSWKFTAPVPGYYDVKVKLQLTNTTSNYTTNLDLYKNGSRDQAISRITTKQLDADNNDISHQGSGQIFLNAGDYIDVRIDQSSGGGITLANDGISSNWINITRVTGPSAIAANENVSFLYGGSTTSVPSGTDTTVVLNTKQHDTHNAYNTSTGDFTAPVSGKYFFCGQVFYSGVTPVADNRTTVAYFNKNGVGELGYQRDDVRSTSSVSLCANPSYTMDLIAGDTVRLRAFQNITAGSHSVQNSIGYTYFAGFRIGN